MRSAERGVPPAGDGHETFFAVAAVFRRHADFPADGGKILFAQDVHAAAAADEDDALLRRALRQQKHRRHAVAARDEQRRFPARRRHREPVAERRDDAQCLARAHPRQRVRAFADVFVEDGKRVRADLKDAERPAQQGVLQRQDADMGELPRLDERRDLRGLEHEAEIRFRIALVRNDGDGAFKHRR